MSGATVVLPKKKDTPQAPAPAMLAHFAAVEAFYDAAKKEFVMRNERGQWLSHPSAQFKMLVKTKGIVEACEVDLLTAYIIDHRDVAYTGSLAGHAAGFYDANGVRMLVTEAPRIIEPQPGEWPTIRALLGGLLGADAEHGEVQLATFLYWLRSGYESVASGKWRPGQIMALAGPIGCGKSLAQKIITECLGGRSADCFRYLSGGTQFNRELFGAEHLFIDDAQASTDFRTRSEMAARLKAIAVGQVHSCHGKHREAVNLRPLWRCSLSLNDEPECLLVLPPLRADIADKIHILRCSAPAVPFQTSTPEAMEAYWERLTAELPAFIADCLQCDAPEGRTDPRFGVQAFHHPALVTALEEQAPEVVLLELIDIELWRDLTRLEWEGTARELEGVLMASDSKVREQARKLLSGWGNACGTYLGRLAKQQSARVESDRDTTRRGWIVRKP